MAVKHSTPPTSDLLLAAFEKHADEMRALTEAQLLARINFDGATATTVVLGALPALRENRAAIHEQCSKMPIRYIDELESIVHAVVYVLTQASTSPTTESRASALVDQARPFRKQLQIDAAAAAGRKLVDAAALAEVPTGNSHLEIAQSLLGLSVVFRAGWSKANGNTGVTEEELVKAAQLGIDLLAALGEEGNPSASSEAQPIAVLRLRALSLLVLVYNECRRSMSYLRFYEDDFNDFTPALVGGRSPRAKQADPTATDPTAGAAMPVAPAIGAAAVVQSASVAGAKKTDA